MSDVAVRPATQADAPALARIDTSYRTGERILAITRSGCAPEETFAFSWQRGEAREATYGDYSEPMVRGALTKTDLFLIAGMEERAAGLLMVVVPSWTDAGEITDLVVDRGARRQGAGEGLVASATRWARERGLRALWVEPRAENGDAIEFYLALGFRISGFSDRLYSNADDARGQQTVYMHLELDRP